MHMRSAKIISHASRFTKIHEDFFYISHHPHVHTIT